MKRKSLVYTHSLQSNQLLDQSQPGPPRLHVLQQTDKHRTCTKVALPQLWVQYNQEYKLKYMIY